MSDKHDSAGNRFLKLAGMTARISGDMAKHRLRRLWQDDATRSQQDAELYTRVGTEIAHTLGGMKGAVMKVGQVFSQYRDVLPRELTDALASLQKDSPPRPFEELLPRLAAAFPDWTAVFAHIEPTALASASIAQVHRARLIDGREVVVKVQYPGIEQAIESDLKQLKLALKLARVLPVAGHLLDELFAEIRTSLTNELDYTCEAAALARFAAFHRHDPRVIIPAVIPEASTRQVLTLTYEPGDPFGELNARYSQAQRDAIGRLLFETMAAQLYQLEAMHCDPHPGNFAARPDGSLVIYDFGCIKQLPPGLSERYRQLTLAALAGDASAVESGLIRLGARNTQQQVALPLDFYRPWLQLAQEGLAAEEPVDFARFPLIERIVKLSRKALPHWRAFQPVPDIVLINRALGGHYWNLRQLGCRLATRPLVEQALAASGQSSSGT